MTVRCRGLEIQHKNCDNASTWSSWRPDPAGFIQGGILATMLDDTMGPKEKKIVALEAAVGALERAIGRPPARTDSPSGSCRLCLVSGEKGTGS